MPNLVERFRAITAPAFAPLFVFFFFLSGIYAIPFISIEVGLIARVKQALFVVFVILMGCNLNWTKAIRTRFTFLCGLWALLNIVNWLIHAEYGSIYLQRVAQILYIFAFVNLVIQIEAPPYQFLRVRAWYRPKIISLICLSLVLLSGIPEITHAISYGFGNNRVNFSIWLSQLVFLTFLVGQSSDKKSIVHAFALATPIIILQVFTGGRTGLMASVAIAIYFATRAGGVRFAALSFIYLLFLITVSASIAPSPEVFPGTYVFRGLGDTVIGETIPQKIDRFTSYRLSIMISACSLLSIKSIITGLGVMNFKGHAMGVYIDVHNIYLRALGELGIAGLVVLLLLLSIPYFGKALNSDEQAARVFCGVFFCVGMVHPDLLTTAISTCMIYWLSYAEACGSRNKWVS